MKKWMSVLCMLAGAALASGLLWPGAARAQTALERVESRLREQMQEGAKAPAANPPQPQPPTAAAPAGARGWLGVVADDEQDRGRGVRVLEVAPEGPAAKAGFRAQDLITSVGGIRVRQMSELADMLEMYKPGDMVAFEVQRAGRSEKLQATLGQRPAAQPAASPTTPAPQLPAAEPKSAPPLLLPAQTPSAPPPAAMPTAPTDDRSRLEALERRIQQLEERVNELERAQRPSLPPVK
jgi:membrane-associated protease RseP (regulator of RpoE activity)